MKRLRTFVEINSQRSLFVDFTRPEPGKKTIVLLNGLTYRTGCWGKLARLLRAAGYGVFMWDPIGQGKTLLRYKAPTGPVSFAIQADDLAVLLDRLQVGGPFNLFGLSYGGALAISFATTYFDQIDSVILAAPFVSAIPAQDKWIRRQMAGLQSCLPFHNLSHDRVYDHFLRLLVYFTFPIAEPIILENCYKLEATYRLAQGARKFKAEDYVNLLPPKSVHLLIARGDRLLDNSIHDKFWECVPAAARMSRIYLEGSEHKIPESVPQLAASIIDLIVQKDATVSNGQTLTARSNGTKISIEQLLPN